MSRKTESNPFYSLVVLTGVVFVITTLAYVVAWLRLAQPAPPTAATELGPVLQFVNDHGDRLMVWEVVALAILAILAMVVDRWRSVPQSDDRSDSIQE